MLLFKTIYDKIKSYNNNEERKNKMKKYKTMDANEAVSRVAYKFTELAGIYPITPASPMAEKIDILSTNNEINFFGNKVKVVEMQSEKGAVALVHGSLQSGILSTTFTASQGLLLMIPTLYKLAGELLPGVIHVAARSLSTHSLSIFGDHQDIYAARQTGVCMLSSSSVEEAYHMAMVAHLSSIKASLPFINFFDGFRTSHEIDKIEEIDLSKIEKLIDKKALEEFRERALNNEHPNQRGTAENDDIYFQHTESRNKKYIEAVDIVEKYMNKINTISKKDYKPFNYYGSEKATSIVVAMGSVCECIEETIDKLNNEGYNVGLVKVHLYRPFSIKHLLEVIPNTVKEVAVLDRTKEPGSCGEPLYLDVVNALKGKNIIVIGGRYGLSSKNTTPAMIKAVYENYTSCIAINIKALPIPGDADCDTEVKMNDVVLIMQCIADPGTYHMYEQGEKNADVYGNDGLSVMDALAIQKYLLEIYPSFPVESGK